MRMALPGVFSLPYHFPYQPEGFFRAIISEMFLKNVQKKRAKTHACVFNAHVRFSYFGARYFAPAPFPSSDSCPTSFSFFRILYA